MQSIIVNVLVLACERNKEGTTDHQILLRGKIKNAVLSAKHDTSEIIFIRLGSYWYILNYFSQDFLKVFFFF